MLNLLKTELGAKERSLSVGSTFSEKRKQSFDNEVFSSSALLNQDLNSNYRKERRVCVFCGLSNHKSHKYLKVTNHLHERRYARKIKLALFASKSVIMQICVPEKIINVKL